MISNVKTITGAPFTKVGEPDKDVVATLKEYLSMAKLGQIRQVHIIAIRQDGFVHRSCEGDKNKAFLIAGATAWAAHRLYESLGVEVWEPIADDQPEVE